MLLVRETDSSSTSEGNRSSPTWPILTSLPSALQVPTTLFLRKTYIYQVLCYLCFRIEVYIGRSVKTKRRLQNPTILSSSSSSSNKKKPATNDRITNKKKGKEKKNKERRKKRVVSEQEGLVFIPLSLSTKGPTQPLRDILDIPSPSPPTPQLTLPKREDDENMQVLDRDDEKKPVKKKKRRRKRREEEEESAKTIVRNKINQNLRERRRSFGRDIANKKRLDSSEDEEASSQEW